MKAKTKKDAAPSAKKHPEKKTETATAEAVSSRGERTFREIGLSQIEVNPLNPRKNFSGTKYGELLASIRAKGVIIPILVRPLEGDRFQIIGGERRFRACTEIAKGNGGIEKARIPAVVQSMSDDDAFDCMTIENLQRADLTGLEEARSFKLYLDKKGPDSLIDLAERIGIHPGYIRRRVRVLSLPEKILSAWEEGNLLYGHLEQLSRIEDPEALETLFEEALNENYSVVSLKRQIDDMSINLSVALFPMADCQVCSQNTEIQRSLFGDELDKGALCLNRACFKMRQKAWITENWTDFRAEHKLQTNGFRFRDEISYTDYHAIYESSASCLSCPNCLTTLDYKGTVNSRFACFGTQKCYADHYSVYGKPETKDPDPDAPRVSWHGEFFREEFYKVKLPKMVNALEPDDRKVLRLSLLSLLETHATAAEAFGKKYDPSYKPEKPWEHWSPFSQAWPILERMDGDLLYQSLREISLDILMDIRTTAASTRHHVAVHLGSDLKTEWIMTKEYLDKKTTREIHAIAEQFGMFRDGKARSYLTDTLGKKEDRFDQCKKSELVQIILQSGVDLFGKVPDEILNVEK